MRTYETFPNGPFYADLNIGESVVAPGGAKIELLGIGYQGRQGRL
jgi:hypothetical protein